MATAIKKKDQVFTKSEVADRVKDLIKEKLNLLPDGVTEEGYFYDLNKTIARIEEMQRLGIKP
jgi:hypothetical protein